MPIEEPIMEGQYIERIIQACNLSVLDEEPDCAKSKQACLATGTDCEEVTMPKQFQ